MKVFFVLFSQPLHMKRQNKQSQQRLMAGKTSMLTLLNIYILDYNYSLFVDL